MKNTKPYFIGLLQAFGVLVYCALVGTFFMIMNKVASGASGGILQITLMLVILVFSVAVSGLIVFGYPAHLALNKNMRKALQVLGYTFLYCLVIIIISVVCISQMGF